MVLLSIIIPNHNIPQLLVRCLRSIPVRPDVQVVVVDDCSSDAEKYRELYPELSRPYLELYSTSQRGGAGCARNIGLKHAKGKWLFFADADDYFTESFQSLLDRCSDSDSDIVYFKANSAMSDDLTKRAFRDRRNNQKLDFFLKSGDDFNLRYFHGTAWPLLIRHQMVIDNNIVFHETPFGNDLFFTCCCGYYAKRIAVDQAAVYTVTERPGSLSAKKCGEKSPEELRIRMNELLQVSDFVFRRTGRLGDTLFSGVFLSWLGDSSVAREMIQIIKKEYKMSCPRIACRIVRAVLVKSWNYLCVKYL